MPIILCGLLGRLDDVAKTGSARCANRAGASKGWSLRSAAPTSGGGSATHETSQLAERRWEGYNKTGGIASGLWRRGEGAWETHQEPPGQGRRDRDARRCKRKRRMGHRQEQSGLGIIRLERFPSFFAACAFLSAEASRFRRRPPCSGNTMAGDGMTRRAILTLVSFSIPDYSKPALYYRPEG